MFLLHLIDSCFLTCICLWQISQIQTCLCVCCRTWISLDIAAFMRSIASHAPCSQGRLSKKWYRAPIVEGGRGGHNLHRVCQTAVKGPPRVCCVFWSSILYFFFLFTVYYNIIILYYKPCIIYVSLICLM